MYVCILYHIYEQPQLLLLAEEGPIPGDRHRLPLGYNIIHTLA